MNPTTIDTRYERVLDTKDLVLLGLSMTIGSGIFVLIDDVAKYSKNLVWLSMLLAGIMSLLTALSYGELSSMFKNNMGEADYIRAVSNDKTANVMGICILISDVFILSTIALGLGNYMTKIIEISTPLLAITSIVIINYLNYQGIRTSTNVSNVMLYIKLAVILVIIVISLTMNTPKENLFNTKNIDSCALSTASLIGLFAYLGFNNMTNFSEETINPAVTIGKSITYTIIIVTIIYTLIAFASLFVMNSTELSQTTTPLAMVMGKLFGFYGFVFFIILAIVSLIDTLLVSSVSESRYIHAILSKMSPQYKNYDMDKTHRTPYLSIIILVILSSLVICCFKNIGVTAIYGDLLIMSIFVIVNIIVIILRYQKPNEPRQFKIPFNIGRVPIPSVIAIVLGLYAICQYIIHISV